MSLVSLLKMRSKKKPEMGKENNQSFYNKVCRTMQDDNNPKLSREKVASTHRNIP